MNKQICLILINLQIRYVQTFYVIFRDDDDAYRYIQTQLT